MASRTVHMAGLTGRHRTHRPTPHSHLRTRASVDLWEAMGAGMAEDTGDTAAIRITPCYQDNQDTIPTTRH